MSEVARSAAEFTSAEAGFAFAVSRAACKPSESYEVDAITAPRLRSFLGALLDSSEAGEAVDWSVAAFGGWWRRGAPGATDQQRASIERALTLRFSPQASRLAVVYLADRQLHGVLQAGDGDLSPIHDRGFDLRRWLDDSGELPLAGRLVILGGVLVAALESMAMRRKLAALLGKLPPLVQEKIRRGMSANNGWDEQVIRRIYEVYCRIARERRTPDEELAALGLYFLISAATFRQARLMRRLKSQLPRRLAMQVVPYHRACLQSGKPELSPAISEVIGGITERLQRSPRQEEAQNG